MKTKLLSLCTAVFLTAVAYAADKVAAPENPGYLTSWDQVGKMGRELHGALKGDQQTKMNSEVVSLETDVTPFIRLEEYPDPKKPLTMIFISVGFVDLVNNLAHAKAIDTIEKGYYQKYILKLTEESGDKELYPLPGIDNPKYWTEDLMNEQLSNFNSVVGLLLGINMAHHYLGQFKTYEKKIMTEQGNTVPINNVLTEKEYAAAVLAGLKNALNNGCTVEGIVPFFEAFDKMKTRPQWSAYFLPNTVQFSKLRKDLEKAQKAFFAGKDI